jgi:hypothetical protein
MYNYEMSGSKESIVGIPFVANFVAITLVTDSSLLSNS